MDDHKQQNTEDGVAASSTDVATKPPDKQFMFKRLACSNVLKIITESEDHLEKRESPRNFKCHVCAKTFINPSCVKQHLKVHFEPRYICDDCPKRFHCKGNLVQHRRIHTGERPFQCFVCGKKFSKKSHLTSHERIHSGDKPYKCRICWKGFTTSGNAAVHFRTHSAERPYQCGQCQKKFSEISNLNRHRMIHTGKKPFACQVCKKTFNVKSSMKRHQRIHYQGRS